MSTNKTWGIVLEINKNESWILPNRNELWIDPNPLQKHGGLDLAKDCLSLIFWYHFAFAFAPSLVAKGCLSLLFDTFLLFALALACSLAIALALGIWSMEITLVFFCFLLFAFFAVHDNSMLRLAGWSGTESRVGFRGSLHRAQHREPRPAQGCM